MNGNYGPLPTGEDNDGGTRLDGQSPFPLSASPPAFVADLSLSQGRRARSRSTPIYRRQQGPGHRAVRIPRRGTRNSTPGHPQSRQATTNDGGGTVTALIRPPPPGVMPWDDVVQSYAENLTGWESDDPSCPRTGSVKLVGKIPGDEYNLEELLETIAQAIDADPQDIVLIDCTKIKDVIRYSRNLERENRELRRQLYEAGLELTD
ncbi:uncharacterized protein RSE6_02221 [Rhynchosporium secalis]|uniref:Uncharacterized protein n=1 Tax=Rhynchosporium secalis TaxID=38038 RepID=A0A1E1LZR3_RHYSE|nr:uncharacterized protein RSE6_02221 [Rhynchosporium secalis]